MRRLKTSLIALALSAAMFGTQIFGETAGFFGTVTAYADEMEIPDAADENAGSDENNETEENVGNEENAAEDENTGDDENAVSDENAETDENVVSDENTEAGAESLNEQSSEEEDEVIEASAEEAMTQEEKTDKDAAEEDKTSGKTEDEEQLKVFADDNDEADPVSASSVNPELISKAVKGLTDAYKALGGSEGSISSLAGIMSKLGGGAAALSGAVAILQMLGIIKDPTTQMLENIMSVLDQQNVSLREINQKLDDLANELKKMQAQGTINDRATKALLYTQNYLKYRTDYLEKMETYISHYKAWVLGGVEDWADGTATRKNLYAYYTIADGQKTQTYSKKKNMKLTVSDSGEEIDTESTIALSAEAIDIAMADWDPDDWNPDTFRDDLLPKLSAAVLLAANDGSLGCSETFMQAWAEYTDEEKASKADEIASDLLNSLVYVISCEQVKKNSAEVNEIVTHMSHIWTNTLSANGGIADQITPLQMTYCFEGEVKDQITQIYNQFDFIMSIYSAFAMTLAGQSTTITKDQKDAAVTQWAEGITKIENARSNTFHGDNYCYLTGSLVTLKEYRVSGEAKIITKSHKNIFHHYVGVRGHSADKWKLLDSKGHEITGLNIISDDNMLVLYSTWSKNKTGGTTSFVNYLNKYGTGVAADFTSQIMTHYGGATEFSLNDGITMKCQFKAFEGSGPSYFKENAYYQIMKQKNRMSCTVLHDKVTGNMFNLATGTETNNALITARAMYYEGHGRWYYDEPWYFAYESHDFNMSDTVRASSGKYGSNMTYEYTTERDVYVLECTAPAKTSADAYGEDEYNPDAAVDEMASCDTVDTAYTAHTGETTRTLEDWQASDIIDEPYETDSDEELKDYITVYVEEQIAAAQDEGKNISLDDAAKEDLVNKMITMIRTAESQAENNGNLTDSAYLDPFGIYGNTEAMTNLAKAVLPDVEIASDGSLMEPVENMITAFSCEPDVYLTFEKSGDSYQPKLTLFYDIEPELLVWDEQSGSCTGYDISDEVMSQLGLSMTIRLNAADAGTGTTATVTHYDDYYTMNVTETLKANVVGSGTDRYVQFTVTKCSPFSLAYASSDSGNNGSNNGSSSKKSGVNTGDGNDMAGYCLMLAAACAAAAAAAFAYRRKYRK